MFDPKNPLARLDRQELLWLAGILKDACRERLEKNLVSQAFEERLYRRGPVAGRLDPRQFLRIAAELEAQLQAGDAHAIAESLRAQVETRRPLASEARGRRRRTG